MANRTKRPPARELAIDRLKIGSLEKIAISREVSEDAVKSWINIYKTEYDIFGTQFDTLDFVRCALSADPYAEGDKIREERNGKKESLASTRAKRLADLQVKYSDLLK